MKLSYLLTIAAAGVTFSSAGASPVPPDFVFSTEGCFVTSGTCTPTTDPSKANPSFTFKGVSFSGSTTTSINLSDLGEFNLGNGNGGYSGNFDLTVTFTSPTNVTPSPQTFTASFAGSVTTVKGVKSGSITSVNFDNTPISFSFQGGTFTLQIDDVGTIPLGGSADLTGLLTVTSLDSIRSTVSPIPEPSTWAMMIVGLVGLGFLAKRQNTLRFA